MFAINHAATALVLKRKYPAVPMVWLLLAVQLMEFLWVIFNYAGIERTTTESVVNTVADVHLAYMPYSHSVVSGIALSVLVWALFAKGLHRPVMAVALGLAALSHLILDLLTHSPDISFAPFLLEPRLGLGLYGFMPMLAFLFEMAYGVLCWLVFRGSRALLAVVVCFNLANLPLYSAAIGSKQMLAGRPEIVVTLVAIQVVVTLVLVGVFSRERKDGRAVGRGAA